MEKGPEFLFGLDMLRRYQCNIDLKANVLRFAVEPKVALPFLAEHELPESVRFEMQGEAEAGWHPCHKYHLGSLPIQKGRRDC